MVAKSGTGPVGKGTFSIMNFTPNLDYGHYTGIDVCITS